MNITNVKIIFANTKTLLYICGMSIIKFEKPNCNPCKSVGEWLTQNNVEHEVINVFDQPDMARKYKIGTTVPVTLNTETGKMVRGFKPDELKQIIK